MSIVDLFASSVLFLLYHINNISSAVNPISVRLFVDDANLFISGSCAYETTYHCREVRTHNVWLRYNKLTLNLSKTCYTIFGKRKIVPLPLQDKLRKWLTQPNVWAFI